MVMTLALIGAFGLGTIFIAAMRTGAVALLQFAVVPLGLVLSAVALGYLGVVKRLEFKSCAIVFGVFAALFLASALAHTQYGSEQTLHSTDFDVRIEREYGDPFDQFVARWRTPGKTWSTRRKIGDGLTHKPPFRLESAGNGVYVIRDSTGKMETRTGPRDHNESN